METGIPACAGALESFGEAAIPATLEALKDPRARPSASNPDPGPLTGLCRVLHPFAPPRAVPILASHLPALRGNALREATTLLLRIGTAEAIAVVNAVLATDSAEQRETVELALFIEADRGLRLRPEEAAALADMLVPRLSEREGRLLQNLLRTLLALDEPRVISFLISQDFLSAEHNRFPEVLQALERARTALPVELLEFLVPLVRDREQQIEESTAATRVFGMLLRLFARASPDAARPHLESAMKSRNPGWAAAAVQAMAISAGVEDACKVVGARVMEPNEGGGYVYRPELLSAPQRTYLVAFGLDMSIRNGGLRSWLSGTGGRHAREVPAALEAIGAPRCAVVIREVLAAIGENRLAAVEREEVRLSDDPRLSEKFTTLEHTYYESGEDVLQLLTLHAIRHREHFIAAQ